MSFTKKNMTVFQSADLSTWVERTEDYFYLNGSQTTEKWIAFEVRDVSDVLSLEVELQIRNWLWNAATDPLQPDVIIYFCQVSDIASGAVFPKIVDKPIAITFSEDSNFAAEYTEDTETYRTYKTIKIPINTSGYSYSDISGLPAFDGDKYRFIIYANKECNGAGYEIKMYVNGISLAEE